MQSEFIKYAIQSLIGGNLEIMQVSTVLLLVIFGIWGLNGVIEFLRGKVV